MTHSRVHRWVLLVLAALCSATPWAQNAVQQEKALLAAAEREPANVHAVGALGEFYFHEQRWQASTLWLGKAYALSSDDSGLGYDLALAETEAGDLSQAKALINAMQAQQESASLHALMAEVDDRSGAYREAAQEYHRAAEIDPSEDHIFDLATYLVQHKQYVGALDDAIKFYRYGAQQFQKSARMKVGLGVALYAANEYDEAVQVLCEAVDLDPKDTRPLQFLGRASRISPQLADAVNIRLKDFVKRYPQNAAANYFYALALWERGGAQGREASDVEQLLTKAETLAPHWYEPHYQLGVVLESQQKYSDALVEMRKAVAIDPDFYPAHYRLAMLYQRTGERAKAESEAALVQRLKAKNDEPSGSHDVTE